MRALIRQCRDLGHTVFCALDYANYKIAESIDPATEFRKDLEEIDRADRMYVLLEERVSAGVQLEMGYAYAKGIHLRIYQMGKAAWSNAAFSVAIGKPIIPITDISEFSNSIISDLDS